MSSALRHWFLLSLVVVATVGLSDGFPAQELPDAIVPEVDESPVAVFAQEQQPAFSIDELRHLRRERDEAVTDAEERHYQGLVDAEKKERDIEAQRVKRDQSEGASRQADNEKIATLKGDAEQDDQTKLAAQRVKRDQSEGATRQADNEKIAEQKRTLKGDAGQDDQTKLAAQRVKLDQSEGAIRQADNEKIAEQKRTLKTADAGFVSTLQSLKKQIKQLRIKNEDIAKPRVGLVSTLQSLKKLMKQLRVKSDEATGRERRVLKHQILLLRNQRAQLGKQVQEEEMQKRQEEMQKRQEEEMQKRAKLNKQTQQQKKLKQVTQQNESRFQSLAKQLKALRIKRDSTADVETRRQLKHQIQQIETKKMQYQKKLGSMAMSTELLPASVVQHIMD